MKTAFALVAALAVSADAFAPASSSSFVGRSRSFAANDSALSMAMERTYIMVRPAPDYWNTLFSGMFGRETIAMGRGGRTVGSTEGRCYEMLH